MASFHSRSNSFPSQSHPLINDVEHHLERLKASQQATSTSCICTNLASLRDLHDGINNLIQMPSVQQALIHEQGQDLINELVEGSLRLVDLCSFSRDVACLTKETIQELESSIRRNRAQKATSVDFNAYVASRKKINKTVNKRVKSLKSSKQNSTALPVIGTMLKEAESLDLLILKSVLMDLSAEKEKSNKRSTWSTFFSKSTQTSDSENMLKQLKTSETTVHEIEEGLEALFRSLVKTRVYLLNVLSH